MLDIILFYMHDMLVEDMPVFWLQAVTRSFEDV